MNTIEGKVLNFGYNNKFGFIKSIISEDRIYFNQKNVNDDIQTNDKVSFDVIRNDRNQLEAINVKLLESFSNFLQVKYNAELKFNSSSIINSISKNWKLEASLETAKNYFFHNNEIEQILDDNKCYVIGRKGSGKSSISEYLLNISNSNIFSEKLSFKNFPFNELYSLENKQYTPPNQYITLWKYLIYSSVARLMVTNENIDPRISESLAKIYKPDPISSLARTIKHWTSAKFGIKVLGTGGDFGVSRDTEDNEFSWIERTNMLEDIIIEHCDHSNYYIIFDELDEDYRAFKHNDYELYNYLITSLFKAVQDVKRTFSISTKNIKPIIFLRDDIYSLIKDADKNKWRDFKIDIEWDINKIKKMLCHRLSIDAGLLANNFEFEEIYSLIFDGNQVNSMNGFDFITRSTHLRPRDYIRYFQVCSKETVERSSSKIKSETIKYVDRAFSNYLRDEIIDEVFPLLPEIEEIFQIISNIGKVVFTYKEFVKEFNIYLEKGTIKEKNHDFVLDTLYKFSVIGNKNNKTDKEDFFKYIYSNSNLNKENKIVLHRGLYKSLQIF